MASTNPGNLLSKYLCVIYRVIHVAHQENRITKEEVKNVHEATIEIERLFKNAYLKGDKKMGWSTLFKYLGMAMEAATEAADAFIKVQAAKDPNSPGGTEITDEEKKGLIGSLDENFSRVCTRICEEVGLPVKNIKVEIELE